MNVVTMSYGILAPISMISQLILIYGYLKIKKMRQHPEMMIFYQCITQSLLDLHWITGIVDVHTYLSSRECQSLGAFFVFCYFVNWDYILFLSIEILIKVRSPLNCNYKSRVLAYHIFTTLSSLGIFILLLSVNNNNGSSIIKTCFVQKVSVYELIVFAPAVIHFPICLFCCVYTLWLSRNLKHGAYATYHIYVVIGFSVSWVPAGVIHGLVYQEFHVKIIGIIGDVIFT